MAGLWFLKMRTHLKLALHFLVFLYGGRMIKNLENHITLIYISKRELGKIATFSFSGHWLELFQMFCIILALMKSVRAMINLSAPHGPGHLTMVGL
ncbi:hypothetical protein D480_0228465 [Pseudomonas aeruginosa]|nr:hypothetical protein D480_0228465 [Pseudomonas aeruginosa]